MGLRLALACALAGLSLAACGSSTPSTSSQEPTQLVPASSALYVEVAVRPQGSLHDAAESALTRIVGHSPDAGLQRLVAKLFKHSRLRYGPDISPWLGEYVGFVATTFSRTGVALIAPTTNPSAALAALKRAAKVRLAAGSYRGVAYEQGSNGGTEEALGIVGHSAVIGGLSAFRAIVDASRGASIASSSGFKAFAALPTHSLVKGYLSASGIGASLQTLIAGIPGGGGLSSRMGQQLLSGVVRRFHGTYGFSLGVTPRSFSIDLRSATPHPSRAGDVGTLPGQSWLALSTAGAAGASTHGLNPAQLAQNPFLAGAYGAIRQRFGIDVIHEVLPALGPLALAIGGTTPLSVGGGLALTPANPAAAARLLASIRRLAARSHSVSVQGGAENFAITKPGLPIPRITVAEQAGRVLATVDESFSQFLSPATRLAGNPDFQRARGSLPAGSLVPLFVDFQTLGTLVKSVPSAASGQGGKVLSALARLDYLTLGVTRDGSDVRVVLGLR